AQYQDNNADGYADRRFCHTSENIRDYLTDNYSYNLERLYYSDSPSPKYFNNTYFSNGESIPSELLRTSGFNWDRNNKDITSAINQGKFMVFHRDHGYTGGFGWAHPQYTISQMGALTNNDKLPVVFSINCHTGEFQVDNCFAEKMLRMNNKGAVGVVAAAYFSYSGYNDALSIGMINAIWPSPGLIPVFGSGGNPNASTPPSLQIKTMGDVVNQGLARMIQTWNGSESSNRYQHELFHYFGDPAMRIWTEAPRKLEASYTKEISCGINPFVINNTTTDVVASITQNGILLGRNKVPKSGGNIQLEKPVSKSYPVILTLVAADYRPIVDTLIVPGNCNLPPVSSFSISPSTAYIGDTITITDNSYFSPQSWKWQFEPAMPVFIDPCSDTSQNVKIVLNEPADYTINLSTENQFGKHTTSIPNAISIKNVNAKILCHDYVGALSETIQFEDVSNGNPSTREWIIEPKSYTFVNGTNKNSKKPSIQFNACKEYSIYLAVSNTGRYDTTQLSINISNTITVGKDSINKLPLPIAANFRYTYSQSIYHKDKIKVPASIETISYQTSVFQPYTTDIKVYMGHTTKDEFDNSTDWFDMLDMTEVYNGTITLSSTTGWVEIELDAPFEYDNTKNLVVAFDENGAGMESHLNSFYCDGPYKKDVSLQYRHSYNNTHPSDPANGVVYQYVPNIKLSFSEPKEMQFMYSKSYQTDSGYAYTSKPNQHILCTEIHTKGGTNPLTLNSLAFDTDLTTNPSDIKNAQLFFTGNHQHFSKDKPFGKAVQVVNNQFELTDSLVLNAGKNIFWLTYSTADNIDCDNIIDAQCAGITINNKLYAPDTNIAGNGRKIISGPTPNNLEFKSLHQKHEIQLNWENPGMFSNVFYENFDDFYTTHWKSFRGLWNAMGYYSGRNFGDYYIASSYFEEHFKDVQIEYIVRKLDKSNSKTGVLLLGQPLIDFRLQEWKSGYKIVFDNEGMWSLQRIDNHVATELIPWTKSTALKKGRNEWNHVKANIIDGTISVYFNGEFQGSYTDKTYLEGRVGLFIYDSSKIGEYHFDEITVKPIIPSGQKQTVTHYNIYKDGQL
ncbi:MAG: C25 family cysteine peptidase, partial [Bacteroidales bacterium]|nr:C25 family cysteine peptidase [Bacteroidales bacterium]